MPDNTPDTDIYFLMVTFSENQLCGGGDDAYPAHTQAEIIELIPTFDAHPLKVLKGNLAAGTFSDVSEDVADFIAEQLKNYDNVPDFVMLNSSKIHAHIDDDSNNLDWDRKHIQQEKMH